MIRALFAGDVWLAPSLLKGSFGVNSSIRKIYNDIVYDLFICNLEAPCKSSDMRSHRRAVLYTEPDLLDSLKIAKTNILTLANNHMHDYGSSGLLKTIELCKKNGFLYVGAGKNLEEARKPLVIDICERKIAIMAYADTASFVGAVAATKNEPGVAPLTTEIILEDISKVKEHVDDIWLFLHWGQEYIGRPMPEQRRISKVLSEGGATIIVGHHPHVLLGYERIKKTDVYYSLGNFIFPDIPLQDNCTHKWGRDSRSSVALCAIYENKSWEIERDNLYLNENGIPEVDNRAETKKLFDKKLKNIADPWYEKKYPLYYLFNKTGRHILRLTDIGKLCKDLIWRFRRKGA